MTEREVMTELVRFVGVLTYGKERFFKQNGCWYDRMFGDCIQNEVLLERITEAINDENEDRPTGWIPVSERLPDLRTEVIYSFDGIVSTGYMTDRDYEGEKTESHWEDLESGATIEPIAWMPLPEPYREGGAE